MSRVRSSIVCGLLLAALPAVAQAEVIYSNTGGSTRTDGGKVVGATFSSFGGTISALGFYDHNQDGLAGTYQVGLWDSSQNLLASVTIDNNSPLVGDFRWANITPVTFGTFITPDTFTIGALLPASMPDIWLDNASLTLGGGFGGAGTGRYTTSGSLVFPATLDSSPYYVVNGGPTVTVPEPASLALLACGAALVLARRKRT